jgi:hypothetical protein
MISNLKNIVLYTLLLVAAIVAPSTIMSQILAPEYLPEEDMPQEIRWNELHPKTQGQLMEKKEVDWDTLTRKEKQVIQQKQREKLRKESNVKIDEPIDTDAENKDYQNQSKAFQQLQMDPYNNNVVEEIKEVFTEKNKTGIDKQRRESPSPVKKIDYSESL